MSQLKHNISLETFTPLQVVSGIKAAVGSAQAVRDAIRDSNSGSLVEYTRSTRVEPMALMDETIVHEPIVSDLLHATSTIFISYYLLGVAAMTNINGVSVLNRLEKFNPKRSTFDAAIDLGYSLGNEAYDVSLPNFKNPVASYKVSVESDGNKAPSNRVSDSLKQLDRLAVGKVVEVKIQENSEQYVIPILIRVIPTKTSPLAIKAIFSLGSQRDTMKERWHRFKEGELSLISDLLFNQDLVKKHIKALTQDKSGFYSEISDRKRGNAISGLLSREPSVATASNIAIISARTAAELERELGGPLSNFGIRERSLDQTAIMLLCIVDAADERVKIYHKSINQTFDYSFRDIKVMGKDQTPDIMEFMKTLLTGKATGAF